MTEGGLEQARREIELMTGEQLPYALRWIKGDTLGKRYENGTIKRLILVLTVKSKRAADTILAKDYPSAEDGMRRRDFGNEVRAAFVCAVAAATTSANA
jgi:hypothetical protein